MELTNPYIVDGGDPKYYCAAAEAEFRLFVHELAHNKAEDVLRAITKRFEFNNKKCNEKIKPHLKMVDYGGSSVVAPAASPFVIRDLPAVHVEDCREQLTALNDQLSALRNGQSALDQQHQSELRELSEQLAKITQSLHNRKRELAELHEHNDRLERELEDKTAEILKLIARVKDLANDPQFDELRKLRIDVGKLQSELDQMRDENARLVEVNTKLQSENIALAATLRRRVSELEQQVHAAPTIAEMAQLQARITELTSLATEHAHDLEMQIKTAADTLKLRVAEQDNVHIQRVADLEAAGAAELQQVKDEFNAAKQEYASHRDVYEHTLLQFRHDVAQLKTDSDAAVTQLQAEINKRNMAITNSNATVAQLQTEVSNCDAAVTQLQAEVSNSKATTAQLQTEVDKRDAAATHLQSEVDKRNAAITTSNAVVAQLQSEVSNSKATATHLQSEVDKRNMAITTSNAAVTQLQSEVSKYDVEVTQLQGEVSKRDITITQLQGEVDKRDITITQLQSEVSKRDITITQLQGEVDKRDITITQLQSEVDKRNVAITTSNAAVTQLHLEVDKRDAVVTSLQTEVARLTRELEDSHATMRANAANPTQSEQSHTYITEYTQCGDNNLRAMRIKADELLRNLRPREFRTKLDGIAQLGVVELTELITALWQEYPQRARTIHRWPDQPKWYHEIMVQSLPASKLSAAERATVSHKLDDAQLLNLWLR